MERLTKRLGSNKGTVVYTKGKYECAIPAEMTNDDIRAVLKKLATYEDLEEQGLLVRLLCKVGDTVWELCLCDDGNYKIFPMTVKTISEYGTLRQVEKDITIWNIYAESDYTYMYKSFADFGKTVFNTKEAAEKKLEEMKSC